MAALVGLGFGDKDHFDPHGPDFHCVDVSSYEDVAWKEKTCESCTVTFPKILEMKSKEVCVFLHYHNLEGDRVLSGLTD